MLDVGHQRPKPVHSEDSFIALKTNLSDPVEYFLGKDYGAVVYPDEASEYYGFPPSKEYVFSPSSQFAYQANGFEPLSSFARGGLAQAWTGGVYPFNDHDLLGFPFDYAGIGTYYDEVADRIGITGAQDDLARFFPMHEHLMEPLDLDEHSERLCAKYDQHRDYLNDKLKCYLGRSRVATLSQDKDNRRKCNQLGRCLWGCPSEALYTPSITLEQCQEYPNFQYVPNMYVSHFRLNVKNRVTHVVATSTGGAVSTEFDVDTLVLAAGTLSTSRIFMDSVFRHSGEIIQLHGLMDNRQMLMPFINLSMIAKPYNPRSYQYHQLAMGIEQEQPEQYIHTQITTLKTAAIHPIIQSIPLDLRTSIFMFRNMHAALGVANINLSDDRRHGNFLTLAPRSGETCSELVINYEPPADEGARLKKAIRKVKKALWRLGCIAPPGMLHIRPMGASVHYSGTIPMSRQKQEFTCSECCQSYDFENLYIVDGTTFPFLPAKNLTFTLMANAVRVAQWAF